MSIQQHIKSLIFKFEAGEIDVLKYRGINGLIMFYTSLGPKCSTLIIYEDETSVSCFFYRD